MKSLITAIVLNYRTPLNVVRCVCALKAQTIANKLEILVVDNHSDDDSIGIIRARLQGIPGVSILESAHNRGYGGGNEVGIHQIKTPYMLIINPDNELEPNALEILVKKMEQDPNIGVIAPKLIHDDGTVRDSYRAFPGIIDVVAKRTFIRRMFQKRINRYVQAHQSPDQERDTDWVVGACMLLRTEEYRALGGFDPAFFLFFEDIDLCRRMWAAGKRVVYCPSAVAKDRKRRLSEGGLWSLLRRPAGRAHIRSAIHYFVKWRGMAESH